MILTTCPKCKKQVSKYAKSCPHCNVNYSITCFCCKQTFEEKNNACKNCGCPTEDIYNFIEEKKKIERLKLIRKPFDFLLMFKDIFIAIGIGALALLCLFIIGNLLK